MTLEKELVVFLIFVVFFGSTVKQTAGFGFALVSVPMLLPFMSLDHIVPIVVPLSLLNDYVITISNRRTLNLKAILTMSGAAISGIPLGIFILSRVSIDLLTIVISGVILISGLLLLSGKTLVIRREKMASVAVGFVSGVLLSTSGLSGPPVTLFLINQRLDKVSFRNNLGLYFSIIDSVAVISLALVGFISYKTLAVDCLLIPSVLAGSVAGNKLLPHIKQGLFVRICASIIVLGAVLNLLDSLME